ncbi:MAG TPA: M48 family metallopeptidase [Burkholderiales bacterium]|nr:M48 family metallopeptidase [Burkholderiales bacterium]
MAIYTIRAYFAAAVAALALAGCATNPITGRSQLQLVSEEQAVSASAQAYTQQMSQYKTKGKLDQNSADVKRVRSIANRLIPQAERMRPQSRNWHWEVNVIDTPEVNAFCMAGGKIAVYKGLIDKVHPTDAELAEVMGHEMGHALAGHQREQMSIALANNMALGVVTVATGAGQLTQQALATAANVAVRLPYSRKMESEADRIGIELAARAGYDPHAAVTLWQKMIKLEGGNAPPAFLSDHPSSEARLQALKALVPKMMPLYEAARKGGK